MFLSSWLVDDDLWVLMTMLIMVMEMVVLTMLCRHHDYAHLAAVSCLHVSMLMHMLVG